MKKVFNKKKVRDFLNWLNYDEENLLDIDENDIYNKTAYKKIKQQIADIKNAEYFFGRDEINAINVMQRFFPLKYEELKNAKEQHGIEFVTRKIFYNEAEGKLHWHVLQGESERNFKIRTETYLQKTKEERKKFLLEIKNKLDKLYGYWYEETPYGYFITDGNKNNGYFKKIVEENSNLMTRSVNNNFGYYSTKSDLEII